MSFLPASLQKDFALVFSGDPALMLPDVEADKDNALRVARETGDWSQLLKPGEVPTLFHVRQLSGTTMTWLASEVRRRQCSMQEQFELAFRLAIKSIDNFGALKVERERVGDQIMATATILDAIYDIGMPVGDAAIGRSIIAEIGALVIQRSSEGLPPK